MTRVIHTGDTHIGYRQYHSEERRADFLRAFDQVVEDAVEAEVDAVVHAGDLFHDRRPDLQDLLGVLSALRTLDDAGVPFLAIVGNHEATRGGQWLDLFEKLGLATRLGSAPHVVGSTAFYGLDHVPKSRRSELDYQFEPHDADHAALVGHGLFTPFAHADWETETVLTESNLAFDAVLLGDNHEPGKAEVDGTWVTYCGSTERASASEREGRGYNLVEFGDDGESSGASISRRALDTRPFAFVEVELAEGEGADLVRERVREHDLDGAVAVVDVTGDGEPVTPASVEEFALQRGALIARVNDRREFDAEAELSVSFADPDDAVRERVREMGLSTAALDVDETVRASKTADANVREEVRTRVSDRLEEGTGAFARAAADAAEDPSEETVDGSSANAPPDATGESGGFGEPAEDAEDAPADSTADEDGGEADRSPSESTDGPTTEAGEDATEPARTASPADGRSNPDEGDAPESDGESQVSMEDYL